MAWDAGILPPEWHQSCYARAHRKQGPEGSSRVQKGPAGPASDDAVVVSAEYPQAHACHLVRVRLGIELEVDWTSLKMGSPTAPRGGASDGLRGGTQGWSIRVVQATRCRGGTISKISVGEML